MKYKSVDKLAELQAKIAALSEQAEVLKNQLKARGKGEYSGVEYVAVVYGMERCTLDVERVKKYLTAAQIRRATVKTESTACRLRPIES